MTPEQLVDHIIDPDDSLYEQIENGNILMDITTNLGLLLRI